MIRDNSTYSTYLFYLVDSADGSPGKLRVDFGSGGIDWTTTGAYFPGNTTDGDTANAALFGLSSDEEPGSGRVEWQWAAWCNQGVVIGPLPASDWTLTMTTEASQTDGVDSLRVGTFDSAKRSLSYLTLPIKDASSGWGGVQIDGLECTAYCQRHTECSECVKDASCQFAPDNGGCVSTDAYVYDFGCPRPQNPPVTRVDLRCPDTTAAADEVSPTSSGRRLQEDSCEQCVTTAPFCEIGRASCRERV